MVNIGFATGAEQPINRDGRVPGATVDEGTLVGIDSNGELVPADAGSGAQVNAVGVAMAPVDDENNYNSETVKQALQAEGVVTLQSGNRISYARYGAILENADEDWGFTPGDPVYLDVGGGFTQTEPSASGELVQVVGYATDDGEAVFLDVDADYETLA